MAADAAKPNQPRSRSTDKAPRDLHGFGFWEEGFYVAARPAVVV